MRLAYARGLVMNSLLLVLPGENADIACVAPLHAALPDAQLTLVGQDACSKLVQAVAEHAPRQVLICAPDAGEIGELLDTLRAWEGRPPCALSLLCAAAPGRELQDALVALGVQAWAVLEGLDADGLAALLALAQARWQREAGLRAQIEALQARLDERKWIDRAKGLLMSARGIGEDEAFGLLRGAAMHANLRLGEVSRSVLEAAQWAEAINRAGQLRMLSQRLARLAVQALAKVDVRRSQVLRKESVERVQANLDYLGTLALDERGAGDLAGVRAAWDRFSGALDERLAPASLAELDAHAQALLERAEALADALEATGARRALRIVNICGRQRMRAQRLAKDALLASVLGLADAQARLAPTMDEFEAALLELERAPLSSSEIRATLAGARDEWLRLVGGVRNADSAEGRMALVRSSEALLQSFDQLTAAYEHSLQVIMS